MLKWFDEIPITSKVVKWPSVPRSTPVELFVDGACAFPQSASLRYAAWAISWASSGVGFLDHQIVMGDHLSGMNQSSFRAELTAMVNAFEMALHIPNKVRIWSDNLAVVRVARRVLQRLRFGTNQSHSDLVIRMQRAAEDFLDGHVTIVKVTSHCAQDKAVDDAESWAFWQNALVDEAAGAINSRRQSQFWAISQSFLQDLKQSYQFKNKAPTLLEDHWGISNLSLVALFLVWQPCFQSAQNSLLTQFFGCQLVFLSSTFFEENTSSSPKFCLLKWSARHVKMVC